MTPRPLTSRRRSLRERPAGRFTMPIRAEHFGDPDDLADLDRVLPIRRRAAREEA